MSTHVYSREGGEKKVRNSVYVECERPLREIFKSLKSGKVVHMGSYLCNTMYISYLENLIS